MKGMDDLLRQAQQMQAKMADIQNELGSKQVEGSSGGGIVRVTCNGRQEILAVSIDKSVVDPDDLDMLQDLVMSAVNDALRLSRQLAEKEMGALTGGFKIPGLM